MPSPEMYMANTLSQIEQSEGALDVSFQPVTDMSATAANMEKLLDCLIIIDHFDAESANTGQ